MYLSIGLAKNFVPVFHNILRKNPNELLHGLIKVAIREIITSVPENKIAPVPSLGNLSPAASTELISFLNHNKTNLSILRQAMSKGNRGPLALKLTVHLSPPSQEFFLSHII